MELREYPGLIHGPTSGAWTVLECHPKDAGVNADTKVARLPRSVTQEDMLVTVHEFAHIELFRKGYPTDGRHGDPIRDGFYRMMEEVAVETKKAKQGLPIYNARDHLDWTRVPLGKLRHDLAMWWLQLAGSYGYSKNAELKAYFEKTHSLLVERGDREILKACLASMQDDWQWANADKWATVLAKHFSPPVEEPKGPDKKRKKQEEEEEKAEEEEREEEERKRERDGDEEDSDLEHQDVPVPPDMRPDHRKKIDVHRHIASKHSKRIVPGGWRKSDSGTSVRYLQNWLRFSPLICAVRAQSAGSILIDFSGSMGWRPEMLEDAANRLPNLWCGVYSGFYDYEAGYSKGYLARLCIVTGHGKVGDMRGLDDERRKNEHGAANNWADSACLAWAIKKAPKPLVWVSDGGTEGDHDVVEKLMRRGKVVMVRTVEDAVKYLEGKRVYGTDSFSDRERYAIKPLKRKK